LVGLADWMLNLPSLIRALALVAILAGAGLIAYRELYKPFAAPCDDLALALRIEEQFPQLNDALASTVQFMEVSEDAPQAGSSSMRKAAIQRTLALAENCDFNQIFNRRWLLWLTGGAISVSLVAGYFLFNHAVFAQTALWRLADPFGSHTWTNITLDDPPHRVAQGQPFFLKGQIVGIVPGAARLEVEGNLKSEKIVPIKIDSNNPCLGTLVAAIDMTQQKGKFRFRIHANDAVFPAQVGQWHEVDVLPPPKFAMLDGSLSPQIELHFPAYTDLHSPVQLTPGTKHIEGIAGTHVRYRTAFDRDLDQAWIEYRPENPGLRVASSLAHLGWSQPLPLVSSLGMSQAVWGRVHARFETPRIFAMDFVPWIAGTYILHVRDELGLVKEFEADLRVLQDPLPTVQLQKPTTNLSVVPDAEIAFKLFVNDDIFAIRSVFLEYRKKDADNRWLDGDSRRIPLYDHKTTGEWVPRLLAMLARSPIVGPELRLRPKNLEIVTKWALKNQFKEGEIVVLQIGAEDFCDLFTDRPAGRSQEIVLNIVSKTEIARLLDEGLGKAQQELVRLQQLQEEALNLVKGIERQKAKNKLSQRELDQLIEAEQIQKQIQERLGNRPEEGLRDDLAKLQQMTKDNKLPSSEAQDQIKTLKNELERLAQEQLPQIEPNLAEARKEMAGTSKPAPKDKSPLEKARKLQEESKKSLDELAKFLDPWAGMHQIKGETRQVLTKQKELKKETEKILDTKLDLIKNGKDAEAMRQADEELKGELDRKAEGQKELAERAQKLLDMMEKAQTKRGESGDKEGAQKLRKAQKIGKEALLPDNMKKVAKDLKDNHPEDAKRQQGENIENLKKMLAALEERKEDDLDKLQKKQKAAASVKENLDELAKKQDKLSKKAKDAGKIDNPEERARELKKLAQEQDKLKEEAQENARELARLQEEQAANGLNRAAQEMDKAARKLEEGQNPEENQEEALDRLEDAQAKLEEFEEELAREQLAQIADRIKGLKERQDATLVRSQNLHKKVMADKKWGKGTIGTLGSDALSQQGLAGETRALKEKIKEAKVFEHVFEKAAKAMEEASQAMENRRESGKDRFAEMDKDEIADENQKAKNVERFQNVASQRLKRLLDALKNEPPQEAANNEPKKDGEGGDDAQQGKMRAGDGIPPVAQLKVLRAEQLEINERTQELAKENPDPKNMNDTLRREIKEIEEEQARLHHLFEQMTAAADKKGDMP